jgi:hypothetical protein
VQDLGTARHLAFAAGALLGAASCSGSIAGDSAGSDAPGAAGPAGAEAAAGDRPRAPGPPPGGGGGGAAPPEVASACAGAAPLAGPSPAFRRLTNREYDRTARDLFGRRGSIVADFPTDAQIEGFDNNLEALTLSPLHVERYRDAAETLAWELVTAARTKPEIVGCDPQGAGRADCLKQFAQRFGRRAFRRPLAADEIAGLMKVADAAAADPDPHMSVALLVQAILQSPNFLFRVEIGARDPARPGARRLTGPELATRLSFLLLGTTPPDALLDAADRGALDTPEGLRAQAAALIKDPRAREALRTFYQQWLQLHELPSVRVDTTAYPTFSEGLRTSMAEESRRFLDDVLWNGDARDLLNRRSTFVDSALAKHYGLPPVSGTAGFVRYDFKPEEPRAGLLTHASVLTVHGREESVAPILRGKFVREALLCTPPPPPPDNVPALPPQKGSESVRQRLDGHRSNPACAGCHGALDPVGFGLETFDLVGRHRTKDPFGNDLTGEGRIDGLEPPRFVGARELGDKLREAPGYPACVVKQVFRFTFGDLESDRDGCALARLAEAFRAGGHGLTQLLLAWVASDAFRYAREEEAR